MISCLYYRMFCRKEKVGIRIFFFVIDSNSDFYIVFFWGLVKFYFFEMLSEFMFWIRYMLYLFFFFVNLCILSDDVFLVIGWILVMFCGKCWILILIWGENFVIYLILGFL